MLSAYSVDELSYSDISISLSVKRTIVFGVINSAEFIEYIFFRLTESFK